MDTNVDIGVDFGPHPCDAGLVVGGEFTPPLGLGDGHPWHPGRLLYYNRSELKQSDHRYMYTPYHHSSVHSTIIINN